MGKPLSMDLRKRVIAAVDGGMSRRAAARFGVSVSSAIRWDAQWRRTGSFAPKPQGGDMRSRRIEARHADVIQPPLRKRADTGLEVLRARLAERGVAASASSLSRFFHRHGITRKKRPAMRSSRIARTS